MAKLDEMELPKRALSYLRSAGFSDAVELTALTRDGVLRIPLCGLRTLRVIEEALAKQGLRLADAE